MTEREEILSGERDPFWSAHDTVDEHFVYCPVDAHENGRGQDALDIMGARLAALRARVEEPNPAVLLAWADWFDNPNLAPGIAFDTPMERATPGMVLRKIASALAAAAPPASEGEEE